MNFDTLSMVRFGDDESLTDFMFENGIQHSYFKQSFLDMGIQVPGFPLIDADTKNIDDWLLAHQVEHQAFAAQLGLNNPFNMLDVDFNSETDFYDWLANHLYIHQQIYAALQSMQEQVAQAAAVPAKGGYTPIIVTYIEWINNFSVITAWTNNSSNQIPWIR